MFERLTTWDQMPQAAAIKELFFVFTQNTFTIANELFGYLVSCFLFRTLYKVLFCLLFFFLFFNCTRVSLMLGMHLIGSDVQVISIFCRSWRNLVILVGSILKLSLVNVSMNSPEETVMWKVTCAQVME